MSVEMSVEMSEAALRAKVGEADAKLAELWDLEVEILAASHQVSQVLQAVWADVLDEAELALDQVAGGASTQGWLTEAAADCRRRRQDWSSVVTEVDVLVDGLCEDLLGR